MPSLYLKNGNSNRVAAKGKVPFVATTTEAGFPIPNYRIESFEIGQNSPCLPWHFKTGSKESKESRNSYPPILLEGSLTHPLKFQVAGMR